MNTLKKLLLTTGFVIASLHAAHAANFKEAIHDGENAREFYLHIPDNVAEQKSLPVVIVLHGGGGNAQQVREQTGMDAVADAHGFIVVYPEGTYGLNKDLRTWNAGLCCGKSVEDNVDDVKYISEIIDTLTNKYGADAGRIYATGHSNGAMMAYRLACELSDKIAGIAANSGQRVLHHCIPSRHVPVLHIHGTADPCVPYEGGDQCGGCWEEAVKLRAPKDLWPCPSVRSIVAEHAHMNECGSEMEKVLAKGSVYCQRYKGCPADGVTELCSISGGGHRWSGATDVGPAACKKEPDKKMCQRYEETVGARNTEIDTGEMIWDFFSHLASSQKATP